MINFTRISTNNTTNTNQEVGIEATEEEETEVVIEEAEDSNSIESRVRLSLPIKNNISSRIMRMMTKFRKAKIWARTLVIEVTLTTTRANLESSTTHMTERVALVEAMK